MAALLGVTVPAGAQRPATEGALFLLFPTGARAVGLGEAVVADAGASDAVWWNPAGIGRASRREAAVHHSQSLLGRGDALALLVPAGVLGVLAVSANVHDFGEQTITADGATPAANGPATGSILPRGVTLAATYATTIGGRATAGVTYKLAQLRVDCTGPCDRVATQVATTTALDLGTQVRPFRRVPLTVGAAVRNLGTRLQVNDGPQADALPTRLQVGAQYRLPMDERRTGISEISLEGDLVDALSFRRPSTRLGLDVAIERLAHLRGGYVIDASGEASPSLGLGLTAARLSLDLARVFAGLSADAGQAPTYLALRYHF
jgi:hypothetical protein